ncbi:MAG: ABC-F family ATP-binding cassette domain-containing protein [Eubacteriales bacterium]
MIKVDGLSYSFPQKDLYDKISFTLEDGQHCAFIGASGSGKSTLAEILMDPDKYMFDGTLAISPDCRIGYVSQFSQQYNDMEMTVFEYIAEEFIKLQSELSTICTLMETSSDTDFLLEKYQQAADAFDAINGDAFESSINKKLNMANLLKHKDLKVSALSGGEFKLIQVIKEMLTNPDVIIMDEPDVFLDFENLTALKDLINTHKGIMLVITHNRYLLNHCFNKIVHLENMDIQEFEGKYSDYNFSLLQRKIEQQELSVAYTEEIERNIVLSDKLRSAATNNAEASRGKALKARVKILDRLEASRIPAPYVDMKQPDINLVAGQNIEETIALKVTDYSAAFDEILLEKVSFTIKSTDKVALIGPNGTGKTTLLRAIFQNSDPSIEIDENVETAYLSQLHGEMLTESNTIQEEFFDAGFTTIGEIQSYIADYGFGREAMDQTIGTLSGGERNILQLAKISSGTANLLLLDEPTSHLDTYSQIALEKAVKTYNGAILMISHDFYSIVNCMDYVLLIEDKTVRRMSIRNFKKMIYSSHFDQDDSEHEQKKKAVEVKIALALKNSDFIRAKSISEKLEEMIG